MIILLKVREICTPQHKNFPKLNLTLDKKSLLKDTHPRSRTEDRIKLTIKAVSPLLLCRQTLRNKWKAISCPQFTEATKRQQEYSKTPETTTSKPLELKIFSKERAALRDSECTRDSRSPTTSSVATRNKTKATSWELSPSWPWRTSSSKEDPTTTSKLNGFD